MICINIIFYRKDDNGICIEIWNDEKMINSMINKSTNVQYTIQEKIPGCKNVTVKVKLEKPLTEEY